MLDGGGLNSFLVDPLLRALASLTSPASVEAPLNGILILLFLGLGIAIATVKWRWLRPWLVGSMAVSLVLWWGCEALGNILTGTTTDVNTGPLFILIALACWPCASLPRVVHDRPADTLQPLGEAELPAPAQKASLNGKSQQFKA